MVSLSGMSGLLTVRVSLSFFHSETSSASSSIFHHRREKEKNTELWASAMPKCGRTIDWAIELVAVCLVYDFFSPIWRKQKSTGIKRMRAAITDERCASNAVDHASSTFARWCLRENMKLKIRLLPESMTKVRHQWAGIDAYLGRQCIIIRWIVDYYSRPSPTQTRREITFSPLFRVKIKSDQHTSSATKYCIKWNIYCTRYTFCFTTELRRLWALLDTLD